MIYEHLRLNLDSSSLPFSAKSVRNLKHGHHNVWHAAEGPRFLQGIGFMVNKLRHQVDTRKVPNS